MADTVIKARLLAAILSSAINQSELVSTPWKARSQVNGGDSLIAGSRLYIVISGGRTGATAPEHVSGVLADGSASLLFLRFEDPDHALGKHFFMGLGGSPALSDRTIDDSEDYQRASLAESVAFFRLRKADMCLAVPRRDWVSEVIPEYPNPLSYTIVGGSIYRCLSNNGGIASTTKPEIEYTEAFETADGYIWKYLGTIDTTTLGRFLTTTHFPVKPLYVDDGSVRWQVQQTAKDGAISTFVGLQQAGTFTDPDASVHGVGGAGGAPTVTLSSTGAVQRISVSNAGAGYPEQSFVAVREKDSPGAGAMVDIAVQAGAIEAPVVDAGGNGYTAGAVAFVVGDGTGAKVSLTLASGVVTGVTIDDAGTGYTWAHVVVIPGTAGAVATAVLAPLGGHGRDMVNQLPVDSVTLYKSITAQDKPLVTGAKFYQISLVTGLPSGNDMQGPAHVDKTVDIDDLSNAVVLSASNHPMFEHLDDQDEKIRTTLTLK